MPTSDRQQAIPLKELFVFTRENAAKAGLAP
jgi:hypothetical protein